LQAQIDFVDDERVGHPFKCSVLRQKGNGTLYPGKISV